MLDILTMLFSRSNRRSNKKDVFDSNRAQRILWIKQVLQDNNIPIYQGHNSKTKKAIRVEFLY